MITMHKPFLENIPSVSISVLIVLCSALFLKYLWKRRWLYYYSAILPGPLSLPFIGSLRLVLAGQKRIFRRMVEIAEAYGLVSRFWLADQLYISTSKPKDVEYILNNCLDKDNIIFYRYIDQDFTSIFTTSLDRWKPHRKNINVAFNQQMLNSFFSVMVKHANNMVKALDQQTDHLIDILPTIWVTNLYVVLETLAAVDANKLGLDYKKIVELLLRYEELLVERVANLLYFFDFFWKRSPEKKEVMVMMNEVRDNVRKTIDLYHKSKPDFSEDSLGSKYFLNCLEKGDYTEEQLVGEVAFMYVAASETSALTLGMVVLSLSMYPEIQEKVYQEHEKVFNDGREMTLDDLNRLDYLERVIKETMRLAPTVPFLARFVDETVKIDSQTYPEGSIALIPVYCIHRNAEFWSDPMKFDPDRFLPEEMNERPRCAYIPFSYGSRNCIGMKFGMNEMKIILTKIMSKFEILPGKYKSWEEVEMDYHFTAKPKDGFNVTLKRRSGFTKI